MSREEVLLKIQALSQRERQLLLLSVIVMSYMMFSVLFFSPQDANQQRLQQQLDQVKTDSAVQAGLLTAYEGGINSDPDKVKKRQLDSLKQQLEGLDSELEKLTVGLVPAKQLPQLLQDVLSRNGALRLSAVETLPISEMSLVESGHKEEVNTDDAVPPATSSTESGSSLSISQHAALKTAETESAGVFKHSVRVALDGGFFPVIDYLQTLEGLPWRLFWQQLSYDVDEYPKARVEFVVYTLSTEEGLFSAP